MAETLIGCFWVLQYDACACNGRRDDWACAVECSSSTYFPISRMAMSRIDLPSVCHVLFLQPETFCMTVRQTCSCLPCFGSGVWERMRLQHTHALRNIGWALHGLWVSVTTATHRGWWLCWFALFHTERWIDLGSSSLVSLRHHSF